MNVCLFVGNDGQSLAAPLGKITAVGGDETTSFVLLDGFPNPLRVACSVSDAFEVLEAATMEGE